MTSYTAILENIFALSQKRGMNRSLSNIEELCKIYNSPEKAFPTIHVAGTNGKGSVCTKIASTLQKEGYTTGLYTSPHISSFRERIRINGQMISEEEFSVLMKDIQETVCNFNIPATFFEIATLLAFLHFRKQKVDIAVIETGLGGEWDATNVITPLVSVITSIGFDHMDVLGPTLQDIARAKAGIIKKGVRVVIGPDVPYSFMKERADKLGCILQQSVYKGDDYDEENQATAQLAIQTLPFTVSETSLNFGLKAKPACRFERHSLKKEVVLDVAHNSHGVARLLQMLKKTYPQHAFRFVVGFSKGKEISECSRLINQVSEAIHLVGGEHPRLASVAELQSYFPNASGEKTIAQGIENALNAPISNVTQNLASELSQSPGSQILSHVRYNSIPEVVVITGSFFIMSEARKALGICEAEDPQIWYDPIKLCR